MLRKLSHKEIVDRQKERAKDPLLPIVVILNDIRSLHNVGSIFRTADGVGVSKIWLCGITGYPPQPQIAKTALGAEERIPWEYAKHARGVVERLKKEGYSIVLLEQMEQGQSYQEYEAKGPTCLIVGNEVDGIEESLISLCDHALEIEMAGIKNSLNVAVAFGIVAYHIRNQVKKIY